MRAESGPSELISGNFSKSILTTSGWDVTPSQGYLQQLSSQLYTWVERGTMRENDCEIIFC